MPPKKAARSAPTGRLSSGPNSPSHRASKRAPRPPNKARYNKEQVEFETYRRRENERQRQAREPLRTLRP